MRENDSLTRLRASRNSRSVLKLKLIIFRGRFPGYPTLVFEGEDDKIVYGRWLARLRPELRYAAFVCKGKAAVITVHRIIEEDRGSLGKGMYLFVDSDFDDNADIRGYKDLFITDHYSVENYLVCEDVVYSIVRDEFPCHDLPDVGEAVTSMFLRDYVNFLRITRELNERIFVYRRTKIESPKSVPRKLHNLAQVDLGLVEPSSLSIDETFPAIHAIPQCRDEELRLEFIRLDPKACYRGKNALLFLMKWLDLLALAFEQQSGPFSGMDLSGKVRKQELTLGAFASKSPLPRGLSEFVASISA